MKLQNMTHNYQVTSHRYTHKRSNRKTWHVTGPCLLTGYLISYSRREKQLQVQSESCQSHVQAAETTYQFARFCQISAGRSVVYVTLNLNVGRCDFVNMLRQYLFI